MQDIHVVYESLLGMDLCCSDGYRWYRILIRRKDIIMWSATDINAITIIWEQETELGESIIETNESPKIENENTGEFSRFFYL